MLAVVALLAATPLLSWPWLSFACAIAAIAFALRSALRQSGQAGQLAMQSASAALAVLSVFLSTGFLGVVLAIFALTLLTNWVKFDAD
jgi:hypothetical protein